MKIGKLLKAIVKTAKANPTLVISAVSAIGPVVKTIKQELKKPKVG
jgi:hypothetical protein